MTPNLRRDRASRDRWGFTLIELIVVMAILATLLGLLIPALAAVRREAKTLLCMNSQRALGLRFRLFADPQTCVNRGDSAAQFGNRFSAWDFQESVYRAAEFWPNAGELEEGRVQYRRGRDPVVCSVVAGRLACVSPGFSLESGDAVAPPENIGYALNRRLLFAPRQAGPVQTAQFVTLSERELDRPYVPLFFDVDAAAAVKRWGAAGPFFSAPPGTKPSIYDGTPGAPQPYWFGALRHGKRLTISFLGGHVLTSAAPLKEPGWDWDYHPPLDP
jgi:prepilin-type N-terminal cleavage/methylation domain-containing protein/prepilin-type processing-associated H-X9-DG protein